jgi:hypothetical protein
MNLKTSSDNNTEDIDMNNTLNKKNLEHLNNICSTPVRENIIDEYECVDSLKSCNLSMDEEKFSPRLGSPMPFNYHLNYSTRKNTSCDTYFDSL